MWENQLVYDVWFGFFVIDMSKKNRFLENHFVERKEWLRKVVKSLANCDMQVIFLSI
jgi:hypothetical protein